MSTARVPRRATLALIACLGGAVACTTEGGADATRHVPSRPPPAPRASGSRLYELGASSRTELSLGTRQRRLRGVVELVRGRLWLDPRALTSARADVAFDLSTIHIEAVGSALVGESSQDARSLTEQSLDWLEIRSPSALARRPERRYANLRLLEVGSASSASAADGQTVPGPQLRTARRVRLRATGELELHGVRLPYTAALTATFEWAEPDAPEGTPERILLATTEPVRLDLFGHDVIPRDERGNAAAGGRAELRRLGDAAVRVELRWTAELTHNGADGPRP